MNWMVCRAAAISAVEVPGGEALFWLGFNAGKAAVVSGEDTARELRSLIDAGNSAGAAGYLHGVVAGRRPEWLRPFAIQWNDDRSPALVGAR